MYKVSNDLIKLFIAKDYIKKSMQHKQEISDNFNYFYGNYLTILNYLIDELKITKYGKTDCNHGSKGCWV
jgi:hypothetical protein